MSLRLRKAVQDAIKDFQVNGFDGAHRLDSWLRLLRQIAIEEAPRADEIRNRVTAAMNMYYRRQTSYAVMAKRHRGVNRFTLKNIEPSLRPELNQRIQSSAQLIKLNRDQAIEKTLQRFAGWASSVPDGGSRTVERGEVKQDILKPLKQLSYEERRVNIDQGHKLMANIDAVVAKQTGAIAAVWHSHWRQPGYDYRPDHKERDQRIYLLRSSWEVEQGYVKPGPAGYLDAITQPGEEVFCRCYVVYLNNMRDLPDDMLTERGRAALEAVRVKRA